LEKQTKCNSNGEHEESSHAKTPVDEGNAEAEEVDVDEAPPYEMNEDSQAHAMNTLIAYEAPMNRGEPLSNFERLMFDWMDTFSADQRAHHEMSKARFQHVYYQIEGVQKHLVEIYYRDK